MARVKFRYCYAAKAIWRGNDSATCHCWCQKSQFSHCICYFVSI